MDYAEVFNRLGVGVNDERIAQIVARARKAVPDYLDVETLTTCFGMMDLTLLNTTDTDEDVKLLCRKVLSLSSEFPEIGFPASVCVSPRLVETAGVALGESDIALTSVAGGFPMAQTYIEVKALECAMVEENGADEIDVVMSVGDFLSGNYGVVEGEIEIIRGELSEDTTLKVILESGMLPDSESVRKATLLALSSGADFVKTSSGKCAVSATPQAVAVMCEAVRDFEMFSGCECGVKVAGGIRTPEDALLYYGIVREIMGERWIERGNLRIGASSLANALLSRIYGTPINYF